MSFLCNHQGLGLNKISLAMKLEAIILIFSITEIYGDYLNKVNLSPSLVFTKEILKLRHEIQTFKEKSLMRIDESFFDLYNNFRSEIDEIIPQFIEHYGLWNISCEEFPMTSLNSQESRRLNNICDDVESFMRKLLKKPEIYLTKLHSSPFKVSYPEKVFTIFFDNLDDIITTKLSENFSICQHNIRLSILMNYEVLVNETVRLHQIGVTKTHIYTRHFSKYLLDFIKTIDTFMYTMKRCAADIDTLGCISPYLKYSCGWSYARCICPHEKMKKFIEKNQNMNKFFDHYHDKFDVINILAKAVENNVREQFELCNRKAQLA